MKYYSAIKKNEILPFATTWMDLLSEISQLDKDKHYDFTHVGNLKIKTSELKRRQANKQDLKYREQTGRYQREGRWVDGENRWRGLIEYLS